MFFLACLDVRLASGLLQLVFKGLDIRLASGLLQLVFKGDKASWVCLDAYAAPRWQGMAVAQGKLGLPGR